MHIERKITGLLGTVLLLMTVACTESYQEVNYGPGSIVPEEVLETMGPDTFFVNIEVPDTIFELIYNCSYKDDCVLSLWDLRYLVFLHRNLEGQAVVGEMIVNKEIAQDVIEIMRELYDASYPIEKARLVDYYDADDEKSMADNNTVCFNWRTVSGTGVISKHAIGLAIDINPLYNPSYKFKEGVEMIYPEVGEEYVDRMSGYPYQIERGDACYNAFVRRGFKWGGSWKSLTDYQHFEK